MSGLILIIVETLFRQILWLLFPGRRTKEILRLRKELQVLQRQVKKPKIGTWDRIFFVSLFRLDKRIVDSLIILKPSTVIGWHRKLVARRWSYGRRRAGRPATEEKVKSLIVEMKSNNRRWGARKIVGELRKIGISISKTTVIEILRENGFDPTRKVHHQGWLRFLRSHAKRYFACDFMTVETAFLKRLYVFAIMDVSTREVLIAAVTKNPTRVWLENVVRSCFMDLQDLPEHLVSDRDGIFGHWFSEFLRESYDMTRYRTPPRTPNCNAHIERWNRTLREELLDHCIVFGERDLKDLVREFVGYYNNMRPHQGIGQDAPCVKLGGNVKFDKSKLRRKRILDGLMVNYSMAA